MGFKKLIIAVLILTAIGGFWLMGGAEYLALESLKASRDALAARYEENSLATLAAFSGIYILVIALSLPGAAVMTLAAGALFGFWPALILVSFASTIGATLAFLTARYLFADAFQSRYADKMAAVNRGIEKEGAFYLLALRLVPLFPFFLINILMGLTRMPATTFYGASQIGMLPGTIAYVYAGTQLAGIESLRDVLSPGMIAAFTVLGIMPLLARRVVDFLRQRKIYARFKKPAHFNYNLIVIGAGAAGLVSAYIGAALKARVALIEKHQMGGDCLNTGCVPSKSILKTAKILSLIRRHKDFGLSSASASFDFPDVMARVRKIIGKIEPNDSVDRYSKLGVECFQGEAKIIDPWTVEVNGQRLTSQNIIVASGAEPVVPDIPGLAGVAYYTSDTIWSLTELPKRLLVLGGGPIGCELAQAFARLGAQVTQIEKGPRLMAREDEDAVRIIEGRLEAEGVRVLTGHQALCFSPGRLVCSAGEQEVTVDFDAVLLALGRKPRLSGFGLEALGITRETDEYLRTAIPNIYMCGDVAGPYQFTHMATHQAWYAAVNALFAPFKSFAVDYRVVPWCTFTDPEIARVGLSETEAREKGIAFEVTHFPLHDLDRALAESETEGFVKVLTPPGTDKILGVTVVGSHAGEMLAEFVLAMKHGLGLNKVLGTIHVYPTWAEGAKRAAGLWRQNHKPAFILNLLETFFRWRRNKG